MGRSTASAEVKYQCGAAPYSTVVTCEYFFVTSGDNIWDLQNFFYVKPPYDGRLRFNFSGRLAAQVPSDDAVVWIAIHESTAQHDYFWGSAESAQAHFGEQQAFIDGLPVVKVPMGKIRAGYSEVIRVPILGSA